MARRAAAAVLIALSGFAAAQGPAKPAADPKEPVKPEAKPPAEAVMAIEKSTKGPECVIKPVMTDDELRACGARIPR